MTSDPTLIKRLLLVSCAVVTMLGLAGPAAAQGPVAQYTALAVDMTSTRPGAGTMPVNIVITRWSTDAERDRLMTTLVEKGERALLGVLRELPRTGSIAPVGGLGFEVRFAQRIAGPAGNERIVLLTDRPMSFWERRAGGRSTDYPFTLVELRIASNGQGEGKVSVAASIAADKANDAIVIENYSDQPVRLQGVRRLEK